LAKPIIFRPDCKIIMNQTNQNQLVRSNEIEWEPLAEKDISGVYVKSLLFDDEQNRATTILLKFEAGARYPLHNHPAGEEIFVLEGDIHLGKDHLFAGDYLFTAPNNLHAVRTDNGCIILLKAEQEVEIIEKRKT
jgi:anti-sigma factor ChrR (cupin superfamily)